MAVDGIAHMEGAISDAGVELSDFDGQLIEPPGSGYAGRGQLAVLDHTNISPVKARSDFDPGRKGCRASRRPVRGGPGARSPQAATEGAADPPARDSETKSDRSRTLT
jgi:hypothetical protein